MIPHAPKLKAVDDRIYLVYKVALLADILAEQGIEPTKILQGTGLSESSLHTINTCISRRQLETVYRNVIKLSKDPAIGLHAGQHIRVTHYGMYGYALLSSANLRDAIEFALKYHELATPTVGMSLHIEEDVAIIHLESLIDIEDLIVFNLEFQFSLILSLCRDIIGKQFIVQEIRTAYPQPSHYSVYEDIFGCPVLFSQIRNEYRFDSIWLDTVPLRSNEITYDMAEEFCSRALLEMQTKSGVAQQVYHIFMTNPGQFPNIETIAKLLYMTPRTLRRKLDHQGTSYQKILTDVRKHIAIQYLRTTQISIEEIAERVGFSDAANFRRAFKRWIGKTPSAFRI